jgi:hypothetical protein
MKAFKTIFLLAFVSGVFYSANGFAQVEKSKNQDYTFSLKSSSGDYKLTGVEVIQISSSGNLLRTVTCQIEPGDPILELANPVAFLRVTAKGDFDGDDEDEILVDDFAVLTKSGNLKMVYHLKGKNK